MGDKSIRKREEKKKKKVIPKVSGQPSTVTVESIEVKTVPKSAEEKK